MRYLVNLQDFRMMNVLDTASLNRIMNSDKKEVYDEWERLLTHCRLRYGIWFRNDLAHLVVGDCWLRWHRNQLDCEEL